MAENNKGKDLDVLTAKGEDKLEPWMMLNTEGNDIAVGRTQDFKIDLSDCVSEGRIYYPNGKGPFPTVLYIHGGAFVGGFNLMDEPVCRQICADCKCVVISPNYRLAPQYKWPAAINELYELAYYFHSNSKEYNMDEKRFVVAGSSAGGNYAAEMCILDYNAGKKIDFKYQILIYPTTIFSMTAGERAQKPVLWEGDPDESLAMLVKSYIPEGEDLTNPLISPFYAPVEAFPKTAIFSGRYDLLWWEGKQMADKLIQGGVETLYKSYANVGHGFMELAGNEHVCRDVKRLIVQELNRNLNGE